MANQFADKLKSIGQPNVPRFFDSLTESGKAGLSNQLAGLDLDAMKQLIETQVKVKATIPIPQGWRSPATAWQTFRLRPIAPPCGR